MIHRSWYNYHDRLVMIQPPWYTSHDTATRNARDLHKQHLGRIKPTLGRRYSVILLSWSLSLCLVGTIDESKFRKGELLSAKWALQITQTSQGVILDESIEPFNIMYLLINRGEAITQWPGSHIFLCLWKDVSGTCPGFQQEFDLRTFLWQDYGTPPYLGACKKTLAQPPDGRKWHFLCVLSCVYPALK